MVGEGSKKAGYAAKPAPQFWGSGTVAQPVFPNLDMCNSSTSRADMPQSDIEGTIFDESGRKNVRKFGQTFLGKFVLLGLGMQVSLSVALGRNLVAASPGKGLMLKQASHQILQICVLRCPHR